ncbi:hypothetical protein GCM10027040_16480 [Halomonas shantousis]
MKPSYHSQQNGISFKATCLRAGLYILFIVILMQGVHHEASSVTAIRFSEGGFTETMQSLLLGFSVALLFYVHTALRHFRYLTLLMLAFLLASLIREQDAFLDTHVFDGAWQVLVSLVVLPSLFVVLRNRRSFIEEFVHYADSFSFGLFASGFLCTYVFSRLFGRSEFWEAFMQEAYLRIFKNVAEEVTELFGYMLLLFAVLELLLLARRQLRRS